MQAEEQQIFGVSAAAGCAGDRIHQFGYLVPPGRENILAQMQQYPQPGRHIVLADQAAAAVRAAALEHQQVFLVFLAAFDADRNAVRALILHGAHRAEIRNLDNLDLPVFKQFFSKRESLRVNRAPQARFIQGIGGKFKHSIIL